MFIFFREKENKIRFLLAVHNINIMFHVDITRTRPVADCVRQAFRTVNQAQSIAKNTEIQQTNTKMFKCMKNSLTMTPNVTS